MKHAAQRGALAVARGAGPSRASRRPRRLAMCALLVGACATPQGGWDVDRLLREEPALAGLRPHRLGDLVPYPAPHARGIHLVLCRWPSRAPIPVRLHLEADRREQAARALASLAAGAQGGSFRFDIDAAPETAAAPPAPGIDIHGIADARAPGPTGIGDTRVACDVGERSAIGFGQLRHAEIRMRSSRLDQIDERIEVAADEWTGALMHEIAHALGFQGHPRIGTSILLRDEAHLRRAGRSALAGEAWHDATLEALYRLAPGRVVGERNLTDEALRAWERIRVLARREGARRLVASVGDRNARLEWRRPDGDALRLHLPFWARQLRGRDRLVAFPGTRTGRRLRGERPVSGAE